MYQHVLFAVDFSDLKLNYFAAQRVKQLTDIFKTKISLVHAVELPTIDIFPDTPNKELTYIDLARKQLAELGKNLNVPAENQYVEVGDPKTVICELMKKLNIDLLIIGHHERHGIYHLLGSTAYACLAHALCEVLIISSSKY